MVIIEILACRTNRRVQLLVMNLSKSQSVCVSFHLGNKPWRERDSLRTPSPYLTTTKLSFELASAIKSDISDSQP